MRFLACVLAWIAIWGISGDSCAQEPDFTAQLEGRWKSDWELTKKHIDADCKLSDKQIALLREMMGKMTVEYDRKRIAISMPEIRMKLSDGTETVVEAWTSEEPLKIIGRTNTQIALFSKAQEPLNLESIDLLTFDDADTYWVYVGQSPIVVGLHVREYFRRVPAE